MIGFTTTATISELIDKRPIGRKRKRTRKKKMPFKGNLKAVQRLLRVKRVKRKRKEGNKCRITQVKVLIQWE